MNQDKSHTSAGVTSRPCVEVSSKQSNARFKRRRRCNDEDEDEDEDAF